MNNSRITNNELAIERTKLANQRTYLAYMRTGFAIAAIAGVFNKKWIVLLGVIMIIGSLIQYIVLNYELKNRRFAQNDILDYIPVVYVPISLGILYLQFRNN